jgi:hypothetical protein
MCAIIHLTDKERGSIMDFSVFQEVISKIDGIINVKIVTENDIIREVHILANKMRSPKQIVRDIESSLIASFDYRIDRKVISIAQIETDDYRRINRILFDRITIGASDNLFECTVTLSYDEEDYSVNLSGIRTVAKSRKLVAEATIKVVEKILRQASVFDIQDVIVTNNRETTFVSVLVNLIINGQEETMVGSVVVKNDLNEAIAKATLDAVNRRVQKTNF